MSEIELWAVLAEGHRPLATIQRGLGLRPVLCPQCNVTTIGEWDQSCSVCKPEDPTFCLQWWVVGRQAP